MPYIYDITFHSNLPQQILLVFAAVLHSRKDCDTWCTLGEIMEVYEQFLIALIMQW